MSRNPFAKSNSKAALMKALSLHGPDGETIYTLLYNDATAGRDRLSYDYNSLTPQSQQDRVRAPYKWDELKETARHQEILNIVSRASTYTRPYYDRGQWGTVAEENWVATWFLWHAFRFRDNRNQAAQPAPPNQYWHTVL